MDDDGWRAAKQIPPTDPHFPGTLGNNFPYLTALMELQQISSTNATMPCLPTTSVPLHFLCTSISHNAMTRCLPTTTTTRVLSVCLARSLSLSPSPLLDPSSLFFFNFLMGKAEFQPSIVVSLFFASSLFKTVERRARAKFRGRHSQLSRGGFMRPNGVLTTVPSLA